MPLAKLRCCCPERICARQATPLFAGWLVEGVWFVLESFIVVIFREIHIGRANDSDQAETLACVGHILVKGCHLVGGLCTGTIGLEAIQIVLNKLWIEVQRFDRSEEHTSELQSLMRNSYAVFCLKKKKIQQ